MPVEKGIVKLQTHLPLKPVEPAIDYNSKLILIGSCFAEHIASKLSYYKFQIVSNPFGILFNPKSIENLLVRALNKQHYTEEEVFELDGRWNCYDAHSDLSGEDAQSTVQCLNNAIKSTHSFFAEASKDKQQIIKSTHIIITLGTAWVYRYKKSGRIVANCHKVPQKEFDKELLSVEDISKSINNMVHLIKSSSNEAEIIFTVSPVRHLKDGFSENMRSKAHLITAVQQAVAEGLVNYFPSYELMMDELRDYRYYDRDMVHPNEIAIDYIWGKFKKVWINPDTYPVMDSVEQIQMGLQHRPFNPQSEQHAKFKKGLEGKIQEIQVSYPFMKFDKLS